VITTVRGRVQTVWSDHAVIEIGGLGLAVYAPASVLAALSHQVGDDAMLQTYLHVRDDALQLYGFNDSRQRALFLALIAISGVGPKVALAVLSGYPVPDLELAVVHDDAKKFESIPGIGKKLSQRLVVELKDKVSPGVDISAGTSSSAVSNDVFVQARSALQNLGLTLRDAEELLRGAPADADVAELVKYALARGREEA
jgi:Holliday junction DNA helicase RuvA